MTRLHRLAITSHTLIPAGVALAAVFLMSQIAFKVGGAQADIAVKLAGHATAIREHDDLLDKRTGTLAEHRVLINANTKRLDLMEPRLFRIEQALARIEGYLGTKRTGDSQ